MFQIGALLLTAAVWASGYYYGYQAGVQVRPLYQQTVSMDGYCAQP